MEENKKYKVYKIIMLVVIVAFISFFITTICMYQYFINYQNKGEFFLFSSSRNSGIESKLDQYRELIDKYYLGEVDEEKLQEGAIKGYIEGLGDDYTQYISKEDMQEYLEDTTGSFIGIGIYMIKNQEANKIEVLAPIKNSPSEKAGLLPGDFIISVNDEEYTGDEMDIASNKIRGEEGSEVKIVVLRGNETLTFNIKREKIKLNPVEGKVIDNQIGYIKFSSFDENTAEDFKSKYEEFSKQGIKSLIIDIRNNGGGIVDQALQIADYITNKDDVLLYEVDKNNNETIKKSENDPIINVPIIILTNENTASSSEILAGALKDLGKAKIVGTKTYGKGVIQQILTFSDGSGLKITTEEYLTPNRNKINEIGVEPDEKVELPQDIENVLNIERQKDTQLQKAIELLKK